ncbi:BadF/BadG/BcrA/BcrD ATPase family protein [Actinosynnema sp. NPDC047251]|uniref:N-acetyl-D-glucosamine kinase n=1 Tax=Saccharothrix espanaensis (strain ATCC 51144 / DSM 44229 / JCM 9112 / NBRC 15066 / NRRL 15764) TaxID=1179773 RepID=K0JU42_SACES|nr:BadF/BadG/BcrA/BcrD ATPase family protein [Saccharothrix espanaensis]CCH27763.1 N-acetyl-D-glucosamine kinase [Saccharothrix espanaensis DSM 44229]
MGFVVGLDAGGTSTRALVLDLDGTRLGAGVAGGANPNSHPPEQAAAHVNQALAAALDGLDATKVESGVLGMAGSSKLTDPAVAALFERAWTGAGLRCPMRVITDCEAAFATGSASPDGTVLVAGTGSIAATITAHRLTATVGGHGWLLGDEGSAYWLGREAVRATLRALEGDEQDELTRAVLTLSDVAPHPAAQARRALLTRVNQAAPIALARYAPLVTAHSAARSAEAIIAEAVAVLADLALAARPAAADTPIVLVGSLVHAHPLGALLRAELTARTRAPVRVATESSAGAAWLAAVEVLGDTAPRPN